MKRNDGAVLLRLALTAAFAVQCALAQGKQTEGAGFQLSAFKESVAVKIVCP